MPNSHHLYHLSKIFAMSALSRLAGYSPREDLPTTSADAIERDSWSRRHIINDLVLGKYIETTGLGQKHYIVTGRAFDECEVEPYEGELNIGTPRNPLATWLSPGIMKQALEDLAGNKARIKEASRGDGKVVLSFLDARSEAEHFFDRTLAENLGELAEEFTGMSKSFAECLRLPPDSLTAMNIESEISEIFKMNAKEVQRLSRTNDALTVLTDRVQASGGWNEFMNWSKARVADLDLTPNQKMSDAVKAGAR